MRTRCSILVVDDHPENVRLLDAVLAPNGYAVIPAFSGAEALELSAKEQPDLILLDILMPDMNGHEVCRRLRSDPAVSHIPIIMVTALDEREIVSALDGGADDFVSKPLVHDALLARVRCHLRIKEAQDRIKRQSDELATLNRELADLNADLEERVRQKVDEVEQLARLQRFLSPQVVDVILAGGNGSLLETHRRDITVVFCDLRRFTAFAELTEPEEVISVLRDYHAGMGEIIYEYKGTLERFAGDGIMVFFNDPLEIDDPPLQAVRMALTMRARAAGLTDRWRKHGYDLALGIGIASGHATLGRIGFEGRSDYGAIGTVTNLASRLCDEAEDDQILIPPRVAAAIDHVIEVEELGTRELKGLTKPVAVFNVLGERNSGINPR